MSHQTKPERVFATASLKRQSIGWKYSDSSEEKNLQCAAVCKESHTVSFGT